MRNEGKRGFKDVANRQPRVFSVISHRDIRALPRNDVHGCIALLLGRYNDRYLLSWIRIIIIPNQPRTSTSHVCSIYSRVFSLSLSRPTLRLHLLQSLPLATSPTFQFSPCEERVREYRCPPR